MRKIHTPITALTCTLVLAVALVLPALVRAADDPEPASFMSVMRMQKLFNREVIQVGDIAGEVENMLFDPMTGNIPLVVLEKEINLFLDGEQVLVPWPALGIASIEDDPQLTLSADFVLEDAKEFEPNGGWYGYTQVGAAYEALNQTSPLKDIRVQRAAIEQGPPREGETPWGEEGPLIAMNRIFYNVLMDEDKGERAGLLHSVMVDMDAGRAVVAYVDPGLMHYDASKTSKWEKLRAVPWPALSPYRTDAGLVLRVKSEDMQKAPMVPEELRRRASWKLIEKAYDALGLDLND